MSLKDADPYQDEGHDGRRITGPLPEYNKFDEYTGVTYYRCRRCEAEALERDHLSGCCES